MTYQQRFGNGSSFNLPRQTTFLKNKDNGLIRYQMDFPFEIKISELNSTFQRGDMYGSSFYTALIPRENGDRRRLLKNYGLLDSIGAVYIREQVKKFNPKSEFNSPINTLGFLAITPNYKTLQIRLFSNKFQYDRKLEQKILEELGNYRDTTSQPSLPLRL
ncbi:MAG: hypothetical protein LAT82_05305 [Nanoarchaeota archaeon]|nr:hypothetical protein [Nanoarchaeota archaeon]